MVVGTNGAIRKSTDGSTWVAIPSGTSNTFYGLNYLNGNFVASGANGTVVTSTDGVNWVVRATDTTAQLICAAYGNDKYVVIPTGLNAAA